MTFIRLSACVWILQLKSTVGCQISTLILSGVVGTLQKYLLYAQVSIPVVEYAITVIYLLLVASLVVASYICHKLESGGWAADIKCVNRSHGH